ncbi:MAG: hypothetical protein ACM33B_13225 [Pseudomonadota bacterium]
MDAQQALDDLMEISSQVEAAVVVGVGGEPLASTLPAERGEALARAAARLLDASGPTTEGRELAQVEASTGEGSLFVVRDGDRTIAAATGPLPTTGLVLYDLRTCLRSLAQDEPEPEPAKPRRRRKQTDEEGAGAAS